jgi:tetratricopeptide (TPR) repeat protein
MKMTAKLGCAIQALRASCEPGILANILHWSFFSLVICLLLVLNVHAGIKIFTHTVRQPFGGSQSPDDARIAAVHKVKREVLDQAGTYLESLTVVRDNAVEKDEIQALAAGVLKAEIISQENYHTKDTFGIIIKARVEVDTSILEDRIKNLLQDRPHLERYKANQERERDLLARIGELESENQKLKTLPYEDQEPKRRNLKEEFRATTKGLSAIELNEKALALWKDGIMTNPDKALEYLSQAIVLNPNYVDAYAFRGFTWHMMGDYDRAVADCSVAIGLDPTSAAAYHYRALVWFNKGSYDHALADLNKAMGLKPEKAIDYAMRGVVWLKKGNYDHAFADVNMAIDLNPRYAEAYASRGLVWHGKGDYDCAITDYNKAIDLNSKYGGAYVFFTLRGHAWRDKRNYDRAITDYNRAIDLNPRHADAYAGRGFALNEKGNYEQAIADLSKAIDLNPRHAGAYRSRGETWISKEDYDHALADLNKAIELDPQHSHAYSLRGMAWFKKGDYGPACSDWVRACELGNCMALNMAKNEGHCR